MQQDRPEDRQVPSIGDLLVTVFFENLASSWILDVCLCGTGGTCQSWWHSLALVSHGGTHESHGGTRESRMSLIGVVLLLLYFTTMCRFQPRFQLIHVLHIQMHAGLTASVL